VNEPGELGSPVTSEQILAPATVFGITPREGAAFQVFRFYDLRLCTNDVIRLCQKGMPDL
jgi:hypothetical protein